MKIQEEVMHKGKKKRERKVEGEKKRLQAYTRQGFN